VHRVREACRIAVRPPIGQQLAELGRRTRPLVEQLAGRGDQLAGLQPAHRAAVGVVGEQIAVQHRLYERTDGKRVGRADQVDRRAHERDPHHPPLDEQLRDVLCAAARESAPQP
jgi:hypothetical protein